MGKAKKEATETVEEILTEDAAETPAGDAAGGTGAAGGNGNGAAPGVGFAEDADPFVDTVDELEALRAERDELRDRFMRALAEAENARKRGERDRREAEQYGGAKLSRDILPVYDNLKRALDAVTDDQRAAAGAVIEGIELTMRELLNVFKKHGIELVSPQVGDRFDPQLHQAMFEAPVPDTRAGDIIQVMTEGFQLHERLLRPAQVGVSSTPAPKADA